jgi:hypothetical protein
MSAARPAPRWTKAADYNRTSRFSREKSGPCAVFQAADRAAAEARRAGAVAGIVAMSTACRTGRRAALDVARRFGLNDVVIYDAGISRRGAANNNQPRADIRGRRARGRRR